MPRAFLWGLWTRGQKSCYHDTVKVGCYVKSHSAPACSDSEFRTSLRLRAHTILDQLCNVVDSRMGIHEQDSSSHHPIHIESSRRTAKIVSVGASRAVRGNPTRKLHLRTRGQASWAIFGY